MSEKTEAGIKLNTMLIADTRGELSTLRHIVCLFLAQREGLEAESLDELETKMIAKYWKEFQSSAPSAIREES